jgi:REP element-mobilizing transposase RayT
MSILGMVGRQLDLFRKRRRRKPGRKPGKLRAVPHRLRPRFARRMPVHVTLRVRAHVYNLRARRCFRPLARAFRGGRDQFGFALNEFSVQGNHLHFIVEADDHLALAKGMQGLSIRMAKALNRVMARSGTVFAQRYHSRILRTVREVRNALRSVLHNLQRHAAEWGRPLAPTWRDPLSSSVDGHDATAPPQTWLLKSVRVGEM